MREDGLELVKAHTDLAMGVSFPLKYISLWTKVKTMIDLAMKRMLNVLSNHFLKTKLSHPYWAHRLPVYR